MLDNFALGLCSAHRPFRLQDMQKSLIMSQSCNVAMLAAIMALNGLDHHSADSAACLLVHVLGSMLGLSAAQDNKGTDSFISAACCCSAESVSGAAAAFCTACLQQLKHMPVIN